MEKKTAKQKIINKIYKLLPIYEGKLLNSDKVLPPQEAYENFLTNIKMVEYRLIGLVRITGKTDYIEDVICILEALKTIGINKHSEVKKSIFACVKNIDKLEESFYGNII